jgi:polygalacturonase
VQIWAVLQKILITQYIETDAYLTAQLITRLRSHVMGRTRTLSLIVRFFALALVLGGALPALAQSANDWARAEEVVRPIRLPEIPARDYRVTDFGARDGGTADARPAILAAIKKASAEGGGRVVIPNPTFSHHLYQVAIAELVGDIPTNTENDDGMVKVAAMKQRG